MSLISHFNGNMEAAKAQSPSALWQCAFICAVEKTCLDRERNSVSMHIDFVISADTC